MMRLGGGYVTVLLILNGFGGVRSAVDTASKNAFGRRHGLKQRIVDAKGHARMRDEPEHVHLSVAEPVDASTLKLKSSISEHKGEAAYTFYDVCPIMNTEAEDEETRGLIWFDETYDHGKRCVPCNNPIMSYKWDAPHHADTPGLIPGDYVRDWNGINSGRWRKEGGLLREGGHKCGMMWAHKIMAKSIPDFNKCFEYNKQEIKDRGQSMRPSNIKKAIYHTEPTLLIQYKKGNPGHQLLDGLLSIFPSIHKNKNNNEYKKVIIHQDWNCSKPSSRYICEILKGIGAFETHIEMINTDTADDTVHCFKELIWPVSGLYGRGQSSMPKHIFLDFHKSLLSHYDLPLPRTNQKKKRIMYYAHCSTPRRCWMNLKEVMDAFEGEFDVFTVHDFGTLTIRKQAEAFNSADILPMVHGGQMANIVFCRQGAFVYEISCTGYSHVASALNTGLIGVNLNVFGLDQSTQCEAPKIVNQATSGQGHLDWNIRLSAVDLAKRLVETRAIKGEQFEKVKSKAKRLR